MSRYRPAVTYDAIVVGLGVMGAATLAELSARGLTVLGLERFTLPHTNGSSQGGTRIIREAYFEHPQYVPLVQRAYAAWQALEARTGRHLLAPTGGLTIGPPDGPLVTGACASARAHGVAHDVLSAADTARTYRVRLREGHVAVREPRAGVLLAARAIGTLLAVAQQHGAVVRAGVEVERWIPTGEGVRVLVAGELLTARRLVLAAGAWMPHLVPALAPHLAVERNVVHWFRPPVPSPSTDRLPVLVIEDTPDHLLYAIPSMRALGRDLEDGVKFAQHHSGVITTADAVDRTPSPADAAAIAPDVARYLPSLDPAPVRSSVCCYTNTPDGHFIVDRHPDHRAVILVSPCSGHGFKFAPVIGGLAADFVADVNVHGAANAFTLGRLL